MRKILIFLLILLVSSTFVYAKTSTSSINWLSKGKGDTLYCQKDGTNCVSAISGEIWNTSGAGVTHAIPAADTYINITIGTQCGLNQGMTCANGVITIGTTGRYFLSHGMSFSGSNNDEYHSSIGVNGSVPNGINGNPCHAVRNAGAAAQTGAVSRSCLLDLAIGSHITFMVENDMDDDDITIEDFNMNLQFVSLITGSAYANISHDATTGRENESNHLWAFGIDGNREVEKIAINSTGSLNGSEICTAKNGLCGSGGGGDSLGNHTAEKVLNMDNYSVENLTYFQGAKGYSPFSGGSADNIYFNNPSSSSYLGDVVFNGMGVRVLFIGSTSFTLQSPNRPMIFWQNSVSNGGRVNTFGPNYNRDYFALGLDSSQVDFAFIIGDYIHTEVLNRNYDHGTQSDPTMFIQSSTDPDTDNTQWMSLTHNKTDAVITSGLGDIILNPASGQVYVNDNVSATDFIDRTPGWDKTNKEALDDLKKIKSKTNNGKTEINHSTLPGFVYRKVPKKIRENCQTLCMDCKIQNCQEVDNYNLPFDKDYLNDSNYVCNEFCDERIVYEDGRSLSAMTTLLTEGIKALDEEDEICKSEIQYLKDELCVISNKYPWCV